MNRIYSSQQLNAQIEALEQLFDTVRLQDAASGEFLDPTTLRPLGEKRSLSPLDPSHRCAEFTQTEDGLELLLSQAVEVEGHSCRLLLSCCMRAEDEQGKRDTAAFFRLLSRFQQEMLHDYITGAYNVRYLEDVFKPLAAERIAHGSSLSVVAIHINEYDTLRSTEASSAVEECLSVAAGVLMPTAGSNPEETILVRWQGGQFLLLSLTERTDTLLEKTRTALSQSPCQFHLSLSRRSRFTARLAAADQTEATAVDEIIRLALQRLV